MIYEGECLRCRMRDEAVAEIVLDRQGESVNTVGRSFLTELGELLDRLEGQAGVEGLLITSAKDAFSVGADVNEFLPMFRRERGELVEWLRQGQHIYSRLEDLPYPSVAALNGYTLGGGLELALAATYRVIAVDGRVGQPEIKLGLIPGLGGTVRLPRLIGADNANDLIASGRDVRAEEALRLKLVSAAVPAERLADAALALLRRVRGDGRWEAARRAKTEPLGLNGIERIMTFTTGKALVRQQAGPHYPAPLRAVEVMEQAATDDRDAALRKEAEAFADLAKSSEAASLIQIFHGDQFLKRRTRQWAAEARPVEHAAVLGAGIMGGGIAYQSAYRGVPAVVKDIAEAPIEQAFGEISRLLKGQMDRGRIDAERMARTIGAVQGTLSYGDFAHVQICVEAVPERLDIKRRVLGEAEQALPAEAVLASNTSTISIDRLAEGLQRPERFGGMHFFNPVHRMPLVEVIRGSRTSEETVATIVGFAQKLGKNPVVVRDGPGFLVNRILFPYMLGFQLLLVDGADLQQIDRTMERFGWPMGPAYLSDVVGLDTAHHAGGVMAEAFPDTYDAPRPLPTELLFEAGHHGQKNGRGYYRYETDKRGRPQKRFDPAVYDVLRPAVKGREGEVSDEEIVERMMLPMIIEGARCLADGIVETATELDMALVYGIGFPPFRGGLLRYADRLGLGEVCAGAGRYARLGRLYEPTPGMRRRAEAGQGFYD